MHEYAGLTYTSLALLLASSNLLVEVILASSLFCNLLPPIISIDLLPIRPTLVLFVHSFIFYFSVPLLVQPIDKTSELPLVDF